MGTSSRPKPVPQLTTAQFEDLFRDEEACRAYLQARRWPNGVHCPRCGHDKVFPVKSMPFKWQCYACAPNQGYRFSVIAGTIFENTNKPLRDWFRVTHYMLASKKGMSALQIQRMMGFGSYSTAHSMCHKIRAAMMDHPQDKLGGIVEVDETYIGGKGKNKHWDKRPGVSGNVGKLIVAGAVKRKGNVVTRVIQRADAATLHKFVREVVSDKVSLLATDESHAYDGLTPKYPHFAVKHSLGEYVLGAIHTQTIDGFWSLIKRGIMGTFHKVGAKYLPLYMAEFQFRYNQREIPDMSGTAIARC
jgi:transposase-like protein